jgi:hypothetical protein
MQGAQQSAVKPQLSRPQIHRVGGERGEATPNSPFFRGDGLQGYTQSSSRRRIHEASNRFRSSSPSASYFHFFFFLLLKGAFSFLLSSEFLHRGSSRRD